LRKDISQHAFKYVYFSGKQIKEIIQLVPKMDKILKRIDAESKQFVEVSTKTGEKRMIAYTFNKKLYVEFATYAKIQLDTMQSQGGSSTSTPWKKFKCDDTPFHKVKNQSLSLTVSEWCMFRDRIPMILNCITSLEMEINGTSPIKCGGSGDRNDPNSPLQNINNYMWSSTNADGDEEELSPRKYYFEEHCLLEGNQYQKDRNRKDRVIVMTDKIPMPDIDLIMRAAYVLRARDLIRKSRKRSCKACQTGSYVDKNTPEHEVGCRSPWQPLAEGIFKKVRDDIDLEGVKKMVMCFLNEVGGHSLMCDVQEFEHTYDGALLEAIFCEKDDFEVDLIHAIKFSRKMQMRSDGECDDGVMLSDEENDDLPADMCPEMAQTYLMV
jgi:hypothetical protein